jgi:hypothetical protein
MWGFARRNCTFTTEYDDAAATIITNKNKTNFFILLTLMMF